MKFLDKEKDKLHISSGREPQALTFLKVREAISCMLGKTHNRPYFFWYFEGAPSEK
jgi:hypothetical protein